MAEQRQPVRIAVNVMRARLTVVGFNLAVATFQLLNIRRVPGGVSLPPVDRLIHLEAYFELVLALGLSIIAIVCFIASTAFDRDGTCTHWSLVAGDLFMYLGLAHSITAFVSPVASVLGQIMLSMPDQAGQLAVIRMAMIIIGGCAWFSTVYVGPAVSLLRSPFGWRVTTALGFGYLLLLLALAHVSAQAGHLEAALAGIDASPAPTLLSELIQPFRW